VVTLARAGGGSRPIPWLLAGLSGLWGLFGIACEAANYPGVYGPQPPMGWQYRPPDPNAPRGSAPAAQPSWGEPAPNPWGAYPGAQPGWGNQPYSGYSNQRPATPVVESPRLEAEINNTQPYVQENLLLTLRVISSANVETATPELPASNDLLFQALRGPTAHSRSGSQGRMETINEFLYAVTPLRPGQVEVPPIRVTGTQTAGGYGNKAAYDVSTPNRLPMQVRPAMPSVQPWLPLEQLTLKANFDRPEKAEEGQPVTLVLELDAVGGTGTQLPSLEPQLQAGDFRVYREQTLTDTKLTADGTHLTGTRTEFFTLVPRSGGQMRLPEIRVGWWNVKTGAKEYAGLPIKTLQVAGEPSAFGLRSGSTLIPAGAEGFWLPIAGLVLLVSGYWIGVWYKGRRIAGREPIPPVLREHWSGALAALNRSTGAALGRLDPSRWWPSLGQRLGAMLPASLRFWMCVRRLDGEPEPAAWSGKLQRLTCHNPSDSERASLPAISEQIRRIYPSVNPEKLGTLMQQLEGTLYGQKSLDFPRWKQEFRQQIRPRPVSSGWFRLSRWYRRERLPALNPRAG